MEHLKGLLEDYSFPYAYPAEHKKTTEAMAEMVPEAQKAVEHAHTVLEKTLTEFKAPHLSIHSRVKKTFSTYRKLVKYKWNLEQIYDVVALRVLTESIGDCYQVLGLVHMIWKPIPRRIKDYIALPKPNGYQSLHTSVITEDGVVEIQIRTEAMHREAELGIASHLGYKEQEDASSNSRKMSSKKFNWLHELKELHTIASDPNKFLNELRMDFFKDRIFVFSPQGDVIDLPEGASAIDFAYAIHSDIGHATSSARANGKMISLGERLHNGDIVEIVTSKNGKPTTKWLEYAKTTGAKRKIRAYIAEKGGIFDKFLLKRS